MKERAIGIETEFGFILLEHESGKLVVSETVLNSLFSKLHVSQRSIGAFFPVREPGTVSVFWTRNGGKFYKDLGHPEYASPECRRWRDVVTHNKAGEHIAEQLLSGVGVDGYTGYLYKHNVARSAISSGDQMESFGCHENYCVFLDPKNGTLFRPLIPFLATREIYGGSGWWTDYDTGTFVRSQRALFLRREISSVTTENTPSGVWMRMRESEGRSIINTRERHYTDSGNGMYRLHLILGDANMLEYAIFLKVGVTALLLSMLEEEQLPFYSIVNETDADLCGDPAVKATQIASQQEDLSEKTIFLVDYRYGRDGTKERVSPLDIQTRYCEAAHQYIRETRFPSPESEDESRMVCRMLSETLAALARRDKKALFGKIDNCTKQLLAEGEIARRGRENDISFSSGEIRQIVDLLYHKLGDGGYYNRLVRASKVARVTSDAEILRAITFPPIDTRAYVRGTAVSLFIDGIVQGDLSVNWNIIGLKSATGSDYTMHVLGDPLASTTPWLSELLAQKCGGV